MVCIDMDIFSKRSRLESLLLFRYLMNFISQLRKKLGSRK